MSTHTGPLPLPAPSSPPVMRTVSPPSSSSRKCMRRVSIGRLTPSTTSAHSGDMRIGAWLVLLTFALVCSSAYAQREPSESDKVTARSLMDRGDKYVEEGKLDAALKAYKAADDIMKVPTTGLELGRTQIKVGQLVEATNTLQRVIQHPVRADESNAFRQARDEARQLSATLPS